MNTFLIIYFQPEFIILLIRYVLQVSISVFSSIMSVWLGLIIHKFLGLLILICYICNVHTIHYLECGFYACVLYTYLQSTICSTFSNTLSFEVWAERGSYRFYKDVFFCVFIACSSRENGSDLIEYGVGPFSGSPNCMLGASYQQHFWKCSIFKRLYPGKMYGERVFKKIVFVIWS